MGDFKTIPVNYTELNQAILCHAETIYRFNGVWEGPDPLTPIVPLFLIQITFAISAARLCVFALKPFNQPPFVAEVLSGIILGPSVIGRIDSYRKMLFPSYNLRVLEPMAHYALVFYAFLMGLQMDVKAISRSEGKAMHTAISGTVVPMVVGVSMFFIFSDEPNKTGSFFWGAALTGTGYHVLSKILDKQKLIHTEVGKTALSAALINDLGSWFFLALGMALSGPRNNIQWSLLSTCAFVMFSIYYIRPALNWIIRKTTEGHGYSEFYICSVLTGVAISGVITDACGTHPMVGAFMFGLIIPNDVLQATLVERIEDFVMGLFMPLFFVVAGLRFNIDILSEDTNPLVVMMVIVLATSAKILGAFAVSFVHKMEPSEAIAIGVLSNTKNIVAMIILEVGQTQEVLSRQTYSIMVVALLVMSMIVSPITIMARPTKEVVPHKRRTIQKAKPEDDLRVLACIHNLNNVPAVINLLEASQSTQRSPISVFVLHLVEQLGRASATVIVHSSRRTSFRNPKSQVEIQTDHIINAFDNYELRSEGVTTQVITARAAYNTMDEDICNIASEKRAAFIIIPFHRQQGPNGEMEDHNAAIRNINEGVLANAPCSVGILIDRGLSVANSRARSIAMLFFGGPDDREALVYAWRMSENPDTCLTVVRFIAGEDANDPQFKEEMNFVEKCYVSIEIDGERGKLLDEDLLNKFKISTISDKTISYTELVLNNEEETVNAIKRLDRQKHNLYLVGKGRGVRSPLTIGLDEWCDCPELGPIGDLLVTSEFESAFQVLVVQQYIKPPEPKESNTGSGSSVSHRSEANQRPSVSETENFEPFASFRRDNET